MTFPHTPARPPCRCWVLQTSPSASPRGWKHLLQVCAWLSLGWGTPIRVLSRNSVFSTAAGTDVLAPLPQLNPSPCQSCCKCFWNNVFQPTIMPTTFQPWVSHLLSSLFLVLAVSFGSSYTFALLRWINTDCYGESRQWAIILVDHFFALFNLSRGCNLLWHSLSITKATALMLWQFALLSFHSCCY